MRSTLVALLILALAACDSGSSTEPDPTPDPPTVREPTVRDWRVAKLSGDQAARLGGPSVAASPRTFIARAGSAAVIGPDGYSDEPLVGVIALTPEAQARGLSLDALPSSTLVHWHIDDDAGRLYASTTSPDDSLHILNRWAPSTVAGTYTASAGRLVDGEIVEDETWTLVVEPGPAAVVHAPASPVRIVDGQQVPGPIGAVDAYGNAVPWAIDVRGALALVGGLPRGDGWGRGELDVIVEDTVAATASVLVYPDLSGPWTVSLVCETPAGTMADAWISETLALAASHDPAAEGYADAVGVDPTGAARVDFSAMPRRVVIEAGDTVYDSATGISMQGDEHNDASRAAYGIGAAVISADTTALIWPAGDRHPGIFARGYDLPLGLPYLRGERHSGSEEPTAIHGLPPVLPLTSSDPLTWSSDDAVAACHSDGWTDATAGVFTVRADG